MDNTNATGAAAETKWVCAACGKSGCSGDCKENKALNRKWAKIHAQRAKAAKESR